MAACRREGGTVDLLRESSDTRGPQVEESCSYGDVVAHSVDVSHLSHYYSHSDPVLVARRVAGQGPAVHTDKSTFWDPCPLPGSPGLLDGGREWPAGPSRLS